MNGIVDPSMAWKIQKFQYYHTNIVVQNECKWQNHQFCTFLSRNASFGQKWITSVKNNCPKMRLQCTIHRMFFIPYKYLNYLYSLLQEWRNFVCKKAPRCTKAHITSRTTVNNVWVNCELNINLLDFLEPRKPKFRTVKAVKFLISSWVRKMCIFSLFRCHLILLKIETYCLWATQLSN